MIQMEKDLVTVAHHEAAHAFISCVNKLSFTEVILSTEDISIVDVEIPEQYEDFTELD